MADWTLTYGATTKTLAEWGISNPVYRAESQGGDAFTFDIATATATSDEVFPNLAEITLKKPGGATFFVGRRVVNPRLGTPAGERHSYEFRGPWLYLERRVFMQGWKSYNPATEELEDVYSSKVLLGQDPTTFPLSLAAQIEEVMTWCRSRNTADYGSPKFAFDTSGVPTANILIDEATDITCAEAIRRLLRWAPDAVVWTDYSTTPPTIRIKRKADLAVVAKPVADMETHETIQLTPRHDLVVPSVRFTFWRSTDVDGEVKRTPYLDKFPSGASGLEEGAMISTFELDGGSITTQTAIIVTEAVAVDNLDWWKAREPKLRDVRITNVSLIDDTDLVLREDGVGIPGPLPLELIDGQIADWMRSPAPEVFDQMAQVQVKYDLYDRDVSLTTSGAVLLKRGAVQTLTHRFKGTDLASDTYVKSERSGGELVPLGLAEAIYNSVSILHWEGSLSWVKEEVDGDVRVGQVLNLSGGRAEWATMTALIQSVVHELETGRTTVQIGPAPFLGPRDLIDLLRINRSRRITMNTTTRASASGGNGTNVRAGQQLPRATTSPGFDLASHQMWIQDGATPAEVAGFVKTDVAASGEDSQMWVVAGTERRARSAATATQAFVDCQSAPDVLAELRAGEADSVLTLTGYSDREVIISTAATGGRRIELRELETCEGGVTKHRIFLCSVAY